MERYLPLKTLVRDLSAQNLTTSYTKIADMDEGQFAMIQALTSAAVAGEILLGYGQAGAEKDIPYSIGRAGMGGDHPVPCLISKGTDLYAKSASGTLNAGILIINFFGRS